MIYLSKLLLCLFIGTPIEKSKYSKLFRSINQLIELNPALLTDFKPLSDSPTIRVLGGIDGLFGETF